MEGEIVSEPVVSYAGAMLKRREVGIRYRYFVEPGEDDENKDEPGAGHFEEDSLYSTPRKGLMYDAFFSPSCSCRSHFFF